MSLRTIWKPLSNKNMCYIACDFGYSMLITFISKKIQIFHDTLNSGDKVHQEIWTSILKFSIFLKQ